MKNNKYSFSFIHIYWKFLDDNLITESQSRVPQFLTILNTMIQNNNIITRIQDELIVPYSQKIFLFREYINPSDYTKGQLCKIFRQQVK